MIMISIWMDFVVAAAWLTKIVSCPSIEFWSIDGSIFERLTGWLQPIPPFSLLWNTDPIFLQKVGESGWKWDSFDTGRRKPSRFISAWALGASADSKLPSNIGGETQIVSVAITYSAVNTKPLKVMKSPNHLFSGSQIRMGVSWSEKWGDK